MIFDLFKKRRLDRIRAEPFPVAWEAVIERNVPMYGRLFEDERRELRGQVQVFLAEKNFEGAGGLVLTDEIRITIAAQACILALRLDDDEPYPRLRSVIVYPTGYHAPDRREEGGIVDEGSSARLGESWPDGAVVLSWSNARSGALNPTDGQNLVLHEFAHQLDQEDGGSDGTPFFEKPVQLERAHPELYAELARYFRQDPAAVLRARAAEPDAS